MWFGVLGPLLVVHEGDPVRLTSTKERVLLAALLMRPNTRLGVQALAQALWDEDQPASAGVTLRNHVRRLRRTLGPGVGARIATRTTGYAVEVSDDECDLLTFHRRFREGTAAARLGDWARAASSLTRALELWRDDLLPDIPAGALRHIGGVELTEMRMQAEEARIDAELRLGGSRALLGGLRRLAARHPLREGLQAQLMLALYRSGRQAEAVAVYRAAYRALAEDLGIAPGPELQSLHTRMLRGDPSLLPRDRVEVETVAAPPQSSPNPAPRQLPAAPRGFVAREEQLAALDRLAERAAGAAAVPGGREGATIVAIDGAAGVGKTALALHWAHRAGARFPDGQLYAQLRGFGPADRPAAQPGDVLRGFLDALGVPPSRIPADPDVQAALYRSTLAGRRVLVVLDNARGAEQVRSLLPGVHGCMAVVTGREPLTALFVTEGATLLSVDVLDHAEARRLLDARLPAGRTSEEPRAADELTALCAGLPLALSIIAARAAARPNQPLSLLLEQLRAARRRLDAMTAGDDAADLRAVLSWSYRGLSAPAARAFRLLGLHPTADLSPPAAAALFGLPLASTRRILDEITRAHLLTQQASSRYLVHDLLHAYAAELADESDSDSDRRAAADRVFDFYLHSAHTAALLLNPVRTPLSLPEAAEGVSPLQLADHREALAWLSAEHAVLLAAIAAAGEDGRDETVWRLAWTLTTFHNRLAHWDAWARVLAQALAATRRLGDRRAEADVGRNLGRLALRRGDVPGAHRHLLETLALFEELGHRTGQADTHLELARVIAREERFDEALTHAERSLRLYHEVGDAAGPAYALNALGWYHSRLGDHGKALKYCLEALDLHTSLGDVAALADTWDSIGYAHDRLGRPGEAIRAFENAAELYRKAGARYDLAVTLGRIADSHDAAADPARAADCRRSSLAILDELGHPDAEPLRERLAAAGRPTAKAR